MKSHEKELLTMAGCILRDAAAKCSTDNDASVSRDLRTIADRVTHEGLSFLMMTLPDFGKAFEQCLAVGQVAPTAFAGWRKRLRLPAFLQGFVSLVFNAETGGLLNDPDIAAIEGVRQICLSFKKLPVPCSPARERAALRGYEEVECELSETMCSGNADLFNQVSALLWSSLLDGSYDPSRLIPRHGPGQTAEGITGNRKYSQRVWYERLEPFFPSDAFIMSTVNHMMDSTEGLECVRYVEVEDEMPVQVRLVPKTLKAPRIIAMEPVCMQYAQQALAAELVQRIESHWLTRGHVNFTDQTINQRLAISASSDESLATLDLSEASDRVPLSLVHDMMSSRPDYRDAILACRSSAAQLPDGKVISLRKFASMGSALCFPIESLYFYIVILVALFEKYGTPVTYRDMYKLSRKVFVYGDDIIVPVDAVGAVMDTLTKFYCRVNTAKSFWNGKFRESCGMDAFDGERVTPTYLRRFRPHHRKIGRAHV